MSDDLFYLVLYLPALSNSNGDCSDILIYM